MLVYERLVRLENLTAELHASDLLLGIKLTSIVTLLVENFFSLMRKHDSMPIQHECGTRRALCVQELQKKMYQGQFFYTGPKSHYPGNTLCVWRPNPCRQKTSGNFMILLRLTEGVLGNTQLDTRERRKLNAYRILYLLVSSSPTNHRCSDCGKDCHSRIGLQSHSRERQKTCATHRLTRRKDAIHSSENLGHQYIQTSSLFGQKQQDKQDNQHNQQSLQFEVLFPAREVVAVKYNRRREKFVFFLAIRLKDLFARSKGKEIDFTDDTVDHLWLDNTNKEDSFYNKNSPYIIIDHVNIEMSTNVLYSPKMKLTESNVSCE